MYTLIINILVGKSNIQGVRNIEGKNFLDLCEEYKTVQNIKDALITTIKRQLIEVQKNILKENVSDAWSVHLLIILKKDDKEIILPENPNYGTNLSSLKDNALKLFETIEGCMEYNLLERIQLI